MASILSLPGCIWALFGIKKTGFHTRECINTISFLSKGKQKKEKRIIKHFSLKLRCLRMLRLNIVNMFNPLLT